MLGSWDSPIGRTLDLQANQVKQSSSTPARASDLAPHGAHDLKEMTADMGLFRNNHLSVQDFGAARSRSARGSDLHSDGLAVGRARAPDPALNAMTSSCPRTTVSLRQNGVGTSFVIGDAILPKGHEQLVAADSPLRGPPLNRSVRLAPSTTEDLFEYVTPVCCKHTKILR
jgi:hypothetical protein